MENGRSCKAEIILNKDYSSSLDICPQTNLCSLVAPEVSALYFSSINMELGVSQKVSEADNFLSLKFASYHFGIVL